jgi:hypothetical protein
VRILREYERAVVFTLGRFEKVRGPGLVLLVPFIQEMVRVDLRIQVIEIPTQDYSLSHAFGAAFDNPSLIAASIVGDGEAETGPLAAWQFNKFLDPMSDSAVLGSS